MNITSKGTHTHVTLASKCYLAIGGDDCLELSSIGIRKSEGRCAKSINRVRSRRRNEAEDPSDAWEWDASIGI